VDCGPLTADRDLEAMAGLRVHLSAVMGHDPNSAFAYLRREG